MSHPKYHIILSDNNLTFDKAIQILLNNGFLFSSYRLRNLEKIHKQFYGCSSWDNLTFGQDSDGCKMVIHSGSWGSDSIQITMKDFLKIEYYNK